jgi:hypothetical protein
VDSLLAVALSKPNNLCSQLELDELLKYGDMSELGKYVGTSLKTGLVKFNFFYTLVKLNALPLGIG